MKFDTTGGTTVVVRLNWRQFAIGGSYHTFADGAVLWTIFLGPVIIVGSR